MDPVVMNATSVLANPQFLNSYAYSLNNPIRYIDPNGESPLEVMGGGIVGFVQGAWGTVKWGANAFVLNPIGTAGPTVAMLEGTGQGIRDFAADPIGEGNKRAIQIGSGVAMAGGWYWNASDYERGVVLGGVAEKMTELYVGGRLYSMGNGSSQASGLKTWEEAGISASEAKRIQNAANRINKPINVVGSRARGDASPISDWDYVVEGMNRDMRKDIQNSLPRGTGGGDILSGGIESGINLFSDTLNREKAHVIFTPK